MGARTSHSTMIRLHARKIIYLPLLLISVAILFFSGGCGWLASRQGIVTDREPDDVVNVVTYNIQVGLFDSQNQAEEIADQVRSEVVFPVTVIYKAPFYRVWIEAHVEADEADNLISLLHADGFQEARRIYEEE